jgi:alkylated DNA repair dioxygenase AlkB
VATGSSQRALFATPPPLPEGMIYTLDFVDPATEAKLLETIAALPFSESKYRQYTAKRRTVSYGASYDFTTNRPLPAPPVPEWLRPLRERVAGWTGIAAADFAFALVTEYRPGTQLGWHRDVPTFEHVVGVSLAGGARMRFRPWPAARGARERAPNAPRRAAFALDLQPRSAYVLRGPARWRWQHAISPTKELRYSITFRTARRGAATTA